MPLCSLSIHRVLSFATVLAAGLSAAGWGVSSATAAAPPTEKSPDAAASEADGETSPPAATAADPPSDAEPIRLIKLPAPSDREVALGVENELLRSAAVDSHKLSASCENGIVTLSGKVDSLLAKRAAFELAQRVRGVRSVINQIMITSDPRSDKEIASDIRDAWDVNPAIEADELTLKVDRATATLQGKVDSLVERQLAAQLAREVRGLERLDNQIEVTLSATPSDDEIAEELQRLFATDAALSDAAIDVGVNEGRIVLTGKVASEFLRGRAEMLAMHAGGEAVDARGLQVNYESRDGMLRRQRLAELTDEQIRDAVRLALRYDPRVLSFTEGIEVESSGGTVTLTGQVGRLQAKQAAEETARGTLGVWRVKNHLKVEWSEDDPSADEIVAFVQAALQRDPYVTRHELRVHCRNGHVSLYGLVDSEFEKQAAEWIASGQRGVVHVNNYLTVAQEWEPKSDAEIKADIEEKLQRTFFDKSNQIRVTVEDGVAILDGQVDTWRQWQAAMDQVVAAGARRPHNLLEVRYHPQHGGSQLYLPR